MAERHERSERKTARLDQPRSRRRSLRVPLRSDTDRFGRFAESFARYMGTARFLAWMTGAIVLWVVWNVPWGPERPRFDAYPFIFLTLMLSLQASYAAPLILLAQNRQEARDRVQQEQDRHANAQSHADMEFLAREVASLRLGLGEVATRDFLRSELRDLLESLQDEPEADVTEESAGHGDGAPSRSEPRPDDPPRSPGS